MAYKNKEDARVYHRRWSKLNRKLRYNLNNAWNAKQDVLVSDYKIKKGCKICGYNKCAKALDFHHRDPSVKDASIAEMRRNCRSFASVSVEIAKCDVVCKNCHSEIHAGVAQTVEQGPCKT